MVEIRHMFVLRWVMLRYNSCRLDWHPQSPWQKHFPNSFRSVAFPLMPQQDQEYHRLDCTNANHDLYSNLLVHLQSQYMQLVEAPSKQYPKEERKAIHKLVRICFHIYFMISIKVEILYFVTKDIPEQGCKFHLYLSINRHIVMWSVSSKSHRVRLFAQSYFLL